ncbi:MAG: hypothetical protein ACJAT7_000699 [Psychromonas sp.]|jgi:hypothetical protein|uniref:hypothetical protein n=1 Tax=Psychromonas sp. TaxID=1884585 RepID=UPI0039E33BBA
MYKEKKTTTKYKQWGASFFTVCLLFIFSHAVLSATIDSNYGATKGFSEGAGYVNTIGIPLPPFDVSELPPVIDESSWVNPQLGLYYINSTASNASDATNGTPNQPRKTLPEVIPAGSYVLIEGEYSLTSRGYTVLKSAGSDASWLQGKAGPVWVVGKSAVLTKGVIIEGTHLFIDNIQFGLLNGSGGRFLIGSSKPRTVSDIVIRNSTFYGRVAQDNASGSALISTGVNDITPAKNIILFQNKFYNHGDKNANYDQDFHMVQVDKGVNGYWFINNLIDSASGSGIQVLGTTTSTKNIYIGSNTIQNVRQSGVGIKYGSDIIISQNILKHIIDTRPLYSESPSPSKGVSYQYGPDNLWILFNKITDASFGIYGGSTGAGEWSIYIIGNYIHDISTPSGAPVGGGAWGDAALMLQGGTYRYIVNNTIRNVNAGIYGPGHNTLYNISENVISGVRDGKHIYIENGTSAQFDGNKSGNIFKEYLVSQIEGLTVDNVNSIKWAGDEFSIGESLTLPNVCTRRTCFSSDDIFEFNDVESPNLKLEVNGHDFGRKHAVYDIFQEKYGFSIEFDIFGLKRPDETSADKWDIGCVEGEGVRTGLPSKPLPPSSLDILIN